MITILILLTTILLAVSILSKRDYERSQELYKLLDKNSNIRVFDNNGLIAILYKNKTIDWIRPVNLYKTSEIKLISDRFEEEVLKIKKEFKK